jgi:hypothetical protein
MLTNTQAFWRIISGRLLFPGNDYLFQDDYAPVNRARSTKECVARKRLKNMSWADGMVYQIRKISRNRSLLEFILCMRTSSFLLIYNHIFSITFKSGDCAAQLRTDRKFRVMMWGCICYNGVGTLTKVEWNINADKYTSILEDNIWPVIVSRK